jgi:Domain of unknown function (DUF1841)
MESVSVSITLSIFKLVLLRLLSYTGNFSEAAMFQAESIQETRPMFFESWQKYRQNKPLSDLEKQIVAVILVHSEYHAFFDEKASWKGEENPFLHLGLHLAIREQIETNRPLGIFSVYQNLLKQGYSVLDVEHRMMEVLADFVWKMQKNQELPDDNIYLDYLKKLCGS